jgi:hypothetical protein
MIDDLVAALRARKVIVFVGAGVSKNLGLPDWKQLVQEMAGTLGYDADIFTQYGTTLELAEFYQIKQSTLGQLRSWMDRTWHRDESIVDGSAIHQLIFELKAPILYTTNYDNWLEIGLRRKGVDFAKIASVGDFAHIKDGITQVIKFHGDLSDDDSLVLTESSYFERLSFESPLDIKFRADVMGKAVLFIGYGLGDINIRLLLYRLHKIWSNSPYASVRPKSYMFLTRPNPIHEAVLSRRGILPVVSASDDPAIGLRTFLEELVAAMR